MQLSLNVSDLKSSVKPVMIICGVTLFMIGFFSGKYIQKSKISLQFPNQFVLVKINEIGGIEHGDVEQKSSDKLILSIRKTCAISKIIIKYFKANDGIILALPLKDAQEYLAKIQNTKSNELFLVSAKNSIPLCGSDAKVHYGSENL